MAFGVFTHVVIKVWQNSSPFQNASADQAVIYRDELVVETIGSGRDPEVVSATLCGRQRRRKSGDDVWKKKNNRNEKDCYQTNGISDLAYRWHGRPSDNDDVCIRRVG